MRRLTLALLVASVAVCSISCKQPERVRATAVDEDEGDLRSIVHLADPRATVQLTGGFHEVEGNSWRWTKGRFSVTLRPPADGAKKGAYLIAKLSIAESTIKHLGGVRLSATVNGTPIDGENYSKTGDYVYRKDVPASALQPEAVAVEFALDKFLAAGQVEGRELGVIVSVIGLEAR
jgi:hypothetical protein